MFDVVSTSPIVWSQMRQFFLMRTDFCTINHDDQHESLWLSIDLFLLDSLVCNTVGLHNILLFTIVQFVQWFTLYNSTQWLWVQSIVYGLQVLYKQLNGASLQDNSQLRYTLYTSSVQDLYLPPRFLLQRQSYAFCQGWCLEAINKIWLASSFF